ncbi:MAG: GMC family oxidoreductase [Paracoccaceae bacterium]
MRDTFDFVIVGGGSAGCAVAGRLADARAGSVCVLEAGPSDRHPLVQIPFGLVWTIGSKTRDWRLKTVPQKNANGREIGVPRGRMLGGSGSINSMVWFRGRAQDFEDWQRPGWGWDDVRPVFEDVEARLKPDRLAYPHALTEALGQAFGPNGNPNPTPDAESAGVFRFNIVNGRRNSAADAYLRPAMEKGVAVRSGQEVSRLLVEGDRVAGVVFADGSTLRAAKGVVLSAGSIMSPAILLRSGLGPADDLRAAGIDVVRDMPGVGANLHDHPGVGLHHAGTGSGYGLEARQAMTWLTSPLRYLSGRSGVLASPSVEGGAFFNARADGGDPDVQSHFIPFLLDHEGRKYSYGAGYFADVCLCRPKSRGALRINRDREIEIDLGLFDDPSDLDTMVAGVKRLRQLLDDAPLEPHRAPEVHPGRDVSSDEAIAAHIRASCGTAYHPCGTLALGGPVDDRCRVKGIEGLWAADASLMPSVTSANTNAPSMMIGHRAGDFIAQDAA